jgi:Rrf2 family protein
MKSGRFAVAAHIMSNIAYRSDRGEAYVSSSSIAISVNTNAVFVRELLSGLRKAGLVETKEGAGGGVRLSRAAKTITLRDIYLASGERAPLPQNSRPRHKPCLISCGIRLALEPTVKEVETAMLSVLARRNLSQVVKAIEATD